MWHRSDRCKGERASQPCEAIMGPSLTQILNKAAAILRYLLGLSELVDDRHMLSILFLQPFRA